MILESEKKLKCPSIQCIGKVTNMCMLDEILNKKANIYQIANKYNADKVYVFGSCARKEEKTNSDIDFLACFNENASLFDQANMIIDLSNLFSCNVDVISYAALKNEYFDQSVKKDMILL